MTSLLQTKIYHFIRDYIAEHGFSPSFVEIAKGIGISSKSISLISRHVHALVESGQLKFHKKGYRNIQVAIDDDFKLPLRGRIAAGLPIEAIEDKQTIDLSFLFKSNDHFALEVRGESMVEEGIKDGDLVICKPVLHAQEGEIVVALIDGHEATLKRVSYKIKDMITLVPAHPTMKPKAYLPHRIQVQGVCVGLLRLKK